MKIVFFGSTNFNKDILYFLIENKIKIHTIFTIPEEFNISYNEEKVKNFNYSNLKEIALKDGFAGNAGGRTVFVLRKVRQNWSVRKEPVSRLKRLCLSAKTPETIVLFVVCTALAVFFSSK